MDVFNGGYETRMSLLFGPLFKPFVEQRTVGVMARCVLENLLNPQRIDALFERTARVQYTRDLEFSSVVDLMGQVVLGIQPSIHAAYQAQAQSLGVSDQAVYDKLNRPKSISGRNAATVAGSSRSATMASASPPNTTTASSKSSSAS